MLQQKQPRPFSVVQRGQSCQGPSYAAKQSVNSSLSPANIGYPVSAHTTSHRVGRERLKCSLWAPVGSSLYREGLLLSGTFCMVQASPAQKGLSLLAPGARGGPSHWSKPLRAGWGTGSIPCAAMSCVLRILFLPTHPALSSSHQTSANHCKMPAARLVPLPSSLLPQP